MTTINSTADIRTWLDNAGLLEHLTADETDRVVELLADAEGRPAYGEDWGDYLDARAQATVFDVATGYDEDGDEDEDAAESETESVFAAERNNTIVALSPELETDHAGQEWFRDLGSEAAGATLVVLDLAEGESPEVGDAIDVDSDGVATLA